MTIQELQNLLEDAKMTVGGDAEIMIDGGAVTGADVVEGMSTFPAYLDLTC